MDRAATAPAAPGLFRQAGYVRLWLANVAGGLGEQFAILALSVTAVLVLHATPFEVGVITALGHAGNLVLGIPIGVWVDRWQKKSVLVTAELIQFAAVASIPVAWFLGGLSILQIMVVAALTGTAGVFFDTAHTSILPLLVGRDRVSEANARLQTSTTTLSIVGPGVGGQILRLVAAPVLYIFTAATHLLSVLLLVQMPVREEPLPKADRVPFRESLATGWRFVLAHPVLRTFMMTAAANNLGAGALTAIVPIFVLRQLGITPETYGLLLSIGAVGGIVGSLIGLKVKDWLGEVRTVVVANVTLPVAFALLPLVTVVPLPPVVAVAGSEFLFGVIIVVGTVSSSGIRAKITPARMMGRVASASRFVSLGAIPVGSVVGGLVGTWLGSVPGLWLSVGLAALAAVISITSPLRPMRDLPPELAYDGED
ncbi:MFS transporter [Pseudarthrobacter sp. P1]|uniref:MFS transporter n=1 Tax=Pseudarthrobacter sp. P1 TaxID=3418418 RepID=UPI003CE9C880